MPKRLPDGAVAIHPGRLARRELGHRVRGTEGAEAADGAGVGHRDSVELAADFIMRLEQRPLALQTHRVGDEAPTRGKRGPAPVQEAGRGHTPADEDRVGRGIETGKGRRRLTFHDAQAGSAQALRIALDERDALGAAFDRDRARAGHGAHPLDGDGAAAGADIPEELSGKGRERGERGRALHPPGELPVVLEGIVRQSKSPGCGWR